MVTMALIVSFKNLDTDFEIYFRSPRSNGKLLLDCIVLDHRYEGRDTYTWSKLGSEAARAAYAAAFPNGATVEQF